MAGIWQISAANSMLNSPMSSKQPRCVVHSFQIATSKRVNGTIKRWCFSRFLSFPICMSDESGSEAKAGAKALSGLIQLTSHQIAVIYLEECYRLKLRADFAKEDKAKEDKAKEKGFVKRFLGFFNSAFGIWLLTLLAATVLPGVWSLGVHMLNAQDQRDQRLERLFLELKYRASKVDE